MTSPGTVENGVLFGHEGELFLAHGGHSVLDIATGRKQIDPAMFAVFEQNILGRAEISKSYGARYLHVIFPDKQSVLRDRFPFPDPVCLGLLYQHHCPQVSGHILNLTSMLREQTRPVFKRTDTHLNDYGIALACADILEAVTGQHQDLLKSLLNCPKKELAVPGDLASKLQGQPPENEVYFQPDWPIRFFSNSISFGNDGLIDIYISPKSIGTTRLLWFGEFFGRGCVKFLSLFFREIVFLRTRFLHDEMVFQLRPDVVVTQNAERYLDVLHPRCCYAISALPSSQTNPLQPDPSVRYCVFCPALVSTLALPSVHGDNAGYQ